MSENSVAAIDIISEWSPDEKIASSQQKLLQTLAVALGEGVLAYQNDVWDEHQLAATIKAFLRAAYNIGRANPRKELSFIVGVEQDDCECGELPDQQLTCDNCVERAKQNEIEF